MPHVLSVKALTLSTVKFHLKVIWQEKNDHLLLRSLRWLNMTSTGPVGHFLTGTKIGTSCERQTSSDAKVAQQYVTPGES